MLHDINKNKLFDIFIYYCSTVLSETILGRHCTVQICILHYNPWRDDVMEPAVLGRNTFDYINSSVWSTKSPTWTILANAPSQVVCVLDFFFIVIIIARVRNKRQTSAADPYIFDRSYRALYFQYTSVAFRRDLQLEMPGESIWKYRRNCLIFFFSNLTQTDSRIFVSNCYRNSNEQDFITRLRMLQYAFNFLRCTEFIAARIIVSPGHRISVDLPSRFLRALNQPRLKCFCARSSLPLHV